MSSISLLKDKLFSVDLKYFVCSNVLNLPLVWQVLWSDQQPGGDHCDPVRGPGGR